MTYKIIDNYIPQQEFIKLKEDVMSSTFPWCYSEYVSYEGDEGHGYYDHNILIKNEPISPFANQMMDFIYAVIPDLTSIIRARFISFTRTNTVIEHGPHVDFDIPHKGMLLYLNTNNGFTRLENGTKVRSVENRALFHDPSKMHNSTTCSDAKRRVVLTVNYV